MGSLVLPEERELCYTQSIRAISPPPSPQERDKRVRGGTAQTQHTHQSMAARPCRIKLLRNGLSSGGKVCMKPDSFAELLSRCSAKFSGSADSEFVARRLFTLEGFELEEAEEVLEGDTVVVSSGEDFIEPSHPLMALQPSQASHSTLSSGSSASELQALPLAQEERLLTPRRAESASSCASSSVTIPATPSSSELAHASAQAGAALQLGALSPPPPTASPPPPAADEPLYHIAVLQAAPLVTRGADHKTRSLPQLNLQAQHPSPSPLP